MRQIEGVELRRARLDDAASIAALMSAADEAEGLVPWVTETDIQEDLRDHDLDLDSDTWVFEQSGKMVAYAELWNSREEEADALEAQGWVMPTHVGLGLGSRLLDLTEEAAGVAAERLSRRPVLLRNFISERNRVAAAMLEARGYRVVRHFFHMAIDLETPVAVPPVPAGLVLRSLDPERDPRALYELIVHAFKDHWNWSPITFQNFWRRVSERDDFDPGLTPVIFDGDRMVGASINATKLDQGWVQDLAVHEAARRRGLGELLLKESFARFRAKGWTRVGLGLDASNATGALRLYERVGMHVTRRFDAYEKQLKPA